MAELFAVAAAEPLGVPVFDAAPEAIAEEFAVFEAVDSESEGSLRSRSIANAGSSSERSACESEPTGLAGVDRPPSGNRERERGDMRNHALFTTATNNKKLIRTANLM